VFAGAPKALAQPHHIFDFVFSWTCVSSPMTASYSMAGAGMPRTRPVGERGLGIGPIRRIALGIAGQLR
jgi:hypothetical protein